MQQRRARAPGKIDAVDILIGDHPFVPALHKPGDDLAGADAIEPEAVHRVGHADRELEVGVAAFDGEGRLRFVLRAFALAVARVVVPGAINIAVIAGFGFHHVVSAQRFGIDLFQVLEESAAVVVGGQDSHPGQGVHDAGRSVQAAGGELAVPFDVRLKLRARFLEPFGIGRLDRSIAVHDDGFELLGSHHRAHAGPAGGAREVARDDGVADEILPGRPDRSDLQIGVMQFAAQLGSGCGDVQPDQVRGIAELDRMVVDPKIDPPVGCAGKDDLVMAGPTQLGSEKSPGP